MDILQPIADGFEAVIVLIREWRFTEDAPGAAMYQRVEESLPYLRKLAEKQAAAD